MKIIKTVAEMSELCNTELRSLKTGFVPTMGALHAGHISLVNQSVKENDATIVSIFVNPKQFNDKSDFENYPVTIDNDLDLLEKANCDIVFIPGANDIYKDYDGYEMDFEGLDKIYEGEFRPGHFRGVIDIVYRFSALSHLTTVISGRKIFSNWQ